MPRNRASTNYGDAEQVLLVRIVEEVLPVKKQHWRQVARRYNAAKDANFTEREEESLKRKFKGLYQTRPTANEPYLSPLVYKAREVRDMIENRDQVLAARGQKDMEEEQSETEHETVTAQSRDEETSREAEEHEEQHALAMAVQPDVETEVEPEYQVVPPPSSMDSIRGRREREYTPSSARAKRTRREPSVPVSTPTVLHGTTDLTQLFLLMQAERSAREDERQAREDKLREELREQRRVEREEALAREDKLREEMLELRRIEREEAAERHRQMMALLTVLVRPREGELEGTQHEAHPPQRRSEQDDAAAARHQEIMSVLSSLVRSSRPSYS
ncbi:hypothetical protein Poli38472_011216 [Pythium oligandrum]|uniref:DUF6818 domain-containing protein n=1 Tax=Pythium oligandrum TaxID=41045 RepID=A0A8K1CPT9_PYTOL|nr:hypothetical protein Poli38472_011216 [Pythium oligandrum]|eukprot:TMW67596.1 hypothetical protein Poli38472_011216 [Pythium oligandrum]